MRPDENCSSNDIKAWCGTLKSVQRLLTSTKGCSGFKWGSLDVTIISYSFKTAIIKLLKTNGNHKVLSKRELT